MPYSPQIVTQNRVPEIMLQGAQAQGQMYANLGKSIGSGIEEYKQNQERDRQAQGVVMGILQTNPNLVRSADDKTIKLIEKFKAGETGLKDNIFLAGWAATAQKGSDEARKRAIEEIQLADMQRRQEEMAKQRQQQELARQLASGVGRGVVRGGVQDNPFVQLTGQAMQAGMAAPSADQAMDYLAKMGSMKGETGQMMTVDDFQKLGAGVNATAVPVSGKPGVVRVTKVDTLAPGSDRVTTNVVGDKIVVTDKSGKLLSTTPIPQSVPYNKFYEDLSKEKTDKVLPALAAEQAYSDIVKLASDPATKIVSGAWATPELALKSLANYLGADYKEVQNTQVLQARLAVPVFNLIRNLGTGTAISDTDLKFAENAAGGRITLDPAAIIRLAEIGAKGVQATKDSYQKKVDEIFGKDPETAAYRSMLALPSLQPSAKPNQSLEDRLKRY